MKKSLFIIVLLLIFVLSACSNSNVSKLLNDTKDISIFYGVSSYAMFGAKQKVIDNILAQFNSLTFEKTDKEIELFTSFNVSIFTKYKSLAHFWVDKNGIFMICDEKYTVKSGNLDYDYLKKVYEESRG